MFLKFCKKPAKSLKFCVLKIKVTLCMVISDHNVMSLNHCHVTFIDCYSLLVSLQATQLLTVVTELATFIFGSICMVHALARACFTTYRSKYFKSINLQSFQFS